MTKRKKNIDRATRGVSGNPAKRRVPAPPASGARTPEERSWHRAFKGVHSVKDARIVSGTTDKMRAARRAQGRGPKS